MYIVDSLGEKPVGEVYLTTPNDKTKLIIHYYSGEEETLAEFRTPPASADANSVEARLRECERHIAWLEEYIKTSLMSAANRHDADPRDGKLNLSEYTKEDIKVHTDEDREGLYNGPYYLENYNSWG